jgi:hypothetical protein
MVIMNIPWTILGQNLVGALALDKTMATDNIFYPNVLLYIKKFTLVTPCYPNRREYARSKAMFGM